MNDNDDLLIYDDDNSLEFIKERLPEEMKEKVSDDDINYIVDLVFDYYESKGFFDEGIEEETEIFIDEEELLAYAVKNAKKDGVISLSKEEIAAIIEGELAYCDSIDLFETE